MTPNPSVVLSIHYNCYFHYWYSHIVSWDKMTVVFCLLPCFSFMPAIDSNQYKSQSLGLESKVGWRGNVNFSENSKCEDVLSDTPLNIQVINTSDCMPILLHNTEVNTQKQRELLTCDFICPAAGPCYLPPSRLSAGDSNESQAFASCRQRFSRVRKCLLKSSWSLFVAEGSSRLEVRGVGYRVRSKSIIVACISWLLPLPLSGPGVLPCTTSYDQSPRSRQANWLGDHWFNSEGAHPVTYKKDGKILPIWSYRDEAKRVTLLWQHARLRSIYDSSQ